MSRPASLSQTIIDTGQLAMIAGGLYGLYLLWSRREIIIEYIHSLNPVVRIEETFSETPQQQNERIFGITAQEVTALMDQADLRSVWERLADMIPAAHDWPGFVFNPNTSAGGGGEREIHLWFE